MRFVVARKCIRVEQRVDFIKRTNMHSNGIILRILMEFYIPVFISLFLNLIYLTLNNPFDYISLVAASTFSLLLILIPFFYAVIVYKNRDRLEDNEHMTSYAKLYEGLKKNTKTSLFTHQLFMIRRILMVIVLCFCTHSLQMQIVLMIIINYITVVKYIAIRPFEQLQDNINSVVNEIAFSVAST